MKPIEDLAAIFKALGDPTRLRIIRLLAKNEGNLCVNALTHQLEVTQSAVSQHLRVLRNVGLVSSKRVGPRVHYAINETTWKKYEELTKKELKSTLLS